MERLEKKELRILFSPSAFERLERQADLLDVPASTWVRALVMEKITAFESATSSTQISTQMNNFLGNMKQMCFDFESMLEDYRNK